MGGKGQEHTNSFSIDLLVTDQGLSVLDLDGLEVNVVLNAAVPSL